jgi:hypothetical protein
VAAPPSSAAEPPATSEALATTEGDLPGVDIDAVESPDHQFSIFYVPGGGGESAHGSSVVVWIGEE